VWRDVGRILWDLFRYMFPVYVGVRFMEHWGWVERLAHWIAPAMQWFHLPGEAALVLITGYWVNVYAAVGILTALPLPPGAITQLALMIAIAHTLPVEVAVLKALGAPVTGLLAYRLGLSLLVGWLYGVGAAALW